MNPTPFENTNPEGEAAAPPVIGVVCCKLHPSVPARSVCTVCSTAVCSDCEVSEPDGNTLCQDCKREQSSSPPVAPPVLGRHLRLPIPRDARCLQHPHVAATQRCKACEGYMCATCDFSLPNDVHICPACASKQSAGLSSKRKKMLIGSYAGAIWSSVGMSCLVSGVFAGMLQSKGEEILLGYIFLLFILGPAITGLSLAVAAKRPRRSNPAGVWIAIVWNSILVGSFILLTIIGMMS